jgi:peroxiredoxin Q/BCP
MSTIRVGDPAPDFRLPALRGGEVALSDFRGKKNVVLFFYPKDASPGCTVEACTFRDNYEDFVALGAEVIGVSSDSEESHDGFARKHSLQFLLASDKDGSVARAFDVDASLFGLVKGRATFVIDKDGVVRDAFSSQIRAKHHVERALALVRSLEGKPAA